MPQTWPGDMRHPRGAEEIPLPLYVATTAPEGVKEQTEALALLARWEVTHAQLSPGLARVPGLPKETARWGERLLWHHACLEQPGEPHWNLAARDEAWRRHCVDRAAETMRQAAHHGAPFYSLHAGWAIHETYEADGRPRGHELTRHVALDQLCRSLDRLAAIAESLGVALLVENSAGRRATGRRSLNPDPDSLALLQEPDELTRILDRVAAPGLGLMLDLGHLMLSSHARGWEPEPVVEAFKPHVRAIGLHRNDALTDEHRLPIETGVEVALAQLAGGLAWPVVLEARGVERAALKDTLSWLADALKITPQIAPEQAL